jgi:phi13 family phage major tail protein
MAVIGLRYPIWSPYVSGPAAGVITYGTAVTGDHAIEANVEWDRNENNLYGDDAVCEYDNSIVGGTITFTLDHLSAALRASMLGEAQIGSTGVYEISDAVPPHGGFGYIRTVRNNGVTTYDAYWYHDVQFSLSGDASTTRGENIEWQTQTVTGRILPVDMAGDGVLKLRYWKPGLTYAAAKSYLDGLA